MHYVQTEEQMKLVKSLAGMKDKEDYYIFTSDDIEKIIASSQTKKQAEIKLELATKLSEIVDKNGHGCFSSSEISDIAAIANTNEQSRLIEELTKIAGDEDDLLFSGYDIVKIIANVKNEEQAIIKSMASKELNKSSRNYKHCDIREIVLKINTKEEYTRAIQMFV